MKAQNKLKIKFLRSQNFKGVYFTLDSILATGIVLVTIVLSSSIYVNEPTDFHLSFLSQDLIRALASITVEDINNGYINSLISDGTIKNLDNTVLEQIAEFWADNEMAKANRTASNVTEPLISNTTGFGIWINNETIYARDIEIKSSLATSKALITGIKKGEVIDSYSRQSPPTLYGPVTAEVRVWQ